MGTTLLTIFSSLRRAGRSLLRAIHHRWPTFLRRRPAPLLLPQIDLTAERLHQHPDCQRASALFEEFLAMQLKTFPSARNGSEAPSFHSKRDCIAYLFFTFGAISRLERTISDRNRGKEWRNWRKSRICKGYFPNGATARFIKHYPKLFNGRLQQAFASGSYAMDSRIRFADGQIIERDCQRADRELRRVLIANHEQVEQQTA